MPKPGPKPYECIRRAWHSEAHSALRAQLKRQMHRLVIQMHKPDTVSSAVWQAQMPRVVLRVDEILYSKAKSQAEYEDLQTLSARLSEAIDIIVGITDDVSAPNVGLRQLPCIEASLILCSQPGASPSGRSTRALAGSRSIFREIRPREQGQAMTGRLPGEAVPRQERVDPSAGPSDLGSRILPRPSIDGRPFVIDPGGAQLANPGMLGRPWMAPPSGQFQRAGGLAGLPYSPPHRPSGQGMFPPPDRTGGPNLTPGRLGAAHTMPGHPGDFSAPSSMPGRKGGGAPALPAHMPDLGGRCGLPSSRFSGPPAGLASARERRPSEGDSTQRLPGAFMAGAPMAPGYGMAYREGLAQAAAGALPGQSRPEPWLQPPGVQPGPVEERRREVPREIPFLQAWQGSEKREAGPSGARLQEVPDVAGRHGQVRPRQGEGSEGEDAQAQGKRQMQDRDDGKGPPPVERRWALNLATAVEDRGLEVRPQSGNVFPFVPLGQPMVSFGFGLQGDCAVPGTDEWQVSLQFQLFMLLRHCIVCKGDACPSAEHCQQAKELVAHLVQCGSRGCADAKCVVARRLLEHNRSCTDKSCPLCAPIRLAQLPTLQNMST